MSDSPSTRTPDGANDRTGGEPARFEQVNWDRIDDSRRWVSPERVTLFIGLLVVFSIFTYHRNSGETFLIFRWNVGWEDWLVLLSLVVIFAYLVVPLGSPRRARRLLRRFKGRPGTILSASVFSGISIVGIWAVMTGYRALIPWEVSIDTLQPPIGTTIPKMNQRDCYASMVEEGGSMVCPGTWMYPLGTDSSGYKLTELLIMGTRPVGYVTITTIGLIVPLATVVGVVAGYYGGLIDDLLMAYVDIQLSFPALLVYLVAFMFILNSMFVFLVAFGLLSWGGIARIVRSETLQRREAGYVLTARAIGAPRPYIIRHHLVPNVTNSAIPAAFHLIAIIVITEAGLSFLGFKPLDQSWGHTIARGFTRAHPIHTWWVAGFPAIALAITVVSCKLLGDGFRDVLDPRGES